MKVKKNTKNPRAKGRINTGERFRIKIESGKYKTPEIYIIRGLNKESAENTAKKIHGRISKEKITRIETLTF